MEFELTEEALSKIMEYAQSKGLVYNTLRNYSVYLKYLARKYKKLDKENLLKILKKSKYPYQRAVLNLINEYCFYENIDFKMVIPKRRAIPRKVPELLTIEEIKKMVESTPKPYNLMLRCIFGIGAGLRVQEVIKLSWGHFYWADWLKEKGDGVVLIKETKRGKNNINNVPQPIMQDLYDYAKEQNLLNEFAIPEGNVVFDFGVEEWNKETFVYNRELWKNQYIKHAYDWIRYNIIKKCCEKAIGRKIKVHWLIHTRSTYLLEVEKIPLERISQLRGHSDIKTTMIYAKMNPKTTLDMMKGTKSI